MKNSILLSLCAFLLFSFATNNVLASDSVLASRLEPGESVSQTISIEDTLQFQIELKKGQFALFNLMQNGIDLKIRTIDPAGESLNNFDSNNGNNGPEIALIDAKAGGQYILQVIPLGENKKIITGQFDLQFMHRKEDVKSHLDAVVDLLAQRNYLPGFAMSIVSGDKIHYQTAKGFANVEKNEPYTTTTTHNIGSTTKTLIGLAIMKMIEEGKLTMETPVNDILPFQMINPHFPQEVIRVKHLVSHTSTLKENDHYEKSYVITEKVTLDKDAFHKSEYKDFKRNLNNEMMPMAHFLASYSTKKGKWYSKKTYLKNKPGEKFSYSNAGATMAALIVELVSEMTFDDYVTTHILKPLGMDDSGFKFSKVDMNKHAMLYGVMKNPLPKYTLITYPDGGLISNIQDLSTYLMALMKMHKGEDGIINASSFQKMTQNMQSENEKAKYGCFWELRKDGYMGHNGGDPGIISMMYFHPEKEVGVLMMSNMIPEMQNAGTQFGKLWMIIRRYAEYF